MVVHSVTTKKLTPVLNAVSRASVSESISLPRQGAAPARGTPSPLPVPRKKRSRVACFRGSPGCAFRAAGFEGVFVASPGSAGPSRGTIGSISSTVAVAVAILSFPFAFRRTLLSGRRRAVAVRIPSQGIRLREALLLVPHHLGFVILGHQQAIGVIFVALHLGEPDKVAAHHAVGHLA